MTKTIFVTNLQEVKGIKIVCNKCGADFTAPINSGKLPDTCIMCRNVFESSYLSETLLAIQKLSLYCKNSNFEAVIETEEKPKT
jgi:hypothetical protein